MWHWPDNRPLTPDEQARERAWRKMLAEQQPVMVGVDLASGPDMQVEALFDTSTGKMVAIHERN